MRRIFLLEMKQNEMEWNERSQFPEADLSFSLSFVFVGSVLLLCVLGTKLIISTISFLISSLLSILWNSKIARAKNSPRFDSKRKKRTTKTNTTAFTQLLLKKKWWKKFERKRKRKRREKNLILIALNKNSNSF